MRAVVQRVNEASVSVAGQTVGSVGNGLLVYLGVMQDDTLLDVQYLADKLLHLRILMMIQARRTSAYWMYRANCCLFLSLRCVQMHEREGDRVMQRRRDRSLQKTFMKRWPNCLRKR